MTDEDRKQRGEYLHSMRTSPGGQIFFQRIDELIVEGWESFINLPVAEKTNKAAFNYQAQYDVLKNLKAWVDDEIRLAK